MDTRDRDILSEPNSAQTKQEDVSVMPLETLEASKDGATTAGIPEKQKGAASKKSLTPFQESLQRLSRDKRAMASIVVIGLFMLIATFGPWIYSNIGGTYKSPINGNIGPQVYHSFGHSELNRLSERPSSMYWLGTDHLGRDTLARLMTGLQISLLVAVLVEIVDVLLGVSIGLLAGYYGGWIDQFLARFTDIMFAFPGLLFVILLTGIFGNQFDTLLERVPYLGPNGNARLVLVFLALALTTWPLMARYVRGQTLQLKEQQFVEAARTSGTSDRNILIRHIVPNLFNIVIIAATINMVATIIAEAGISLLGLGVQIPGSSIGLMINEGSPFLRTNPFQAMLPATILAVIVMAFSFLGDGLRDAFDPRTKD